MTEKAELKEEDRTFILALLSAVLVVLCIIGGFLGLPFASEAFSSIMTLISSAWAFYFAKKANK